MTVRLNQVPRQQSTFEVSMRVSLDASLFIIGAMKSGTMSLHSIWIFSAVTTLPFFEPDCINLRVDYLSPYHYLIRGKDVPGRSEWRTVGTLIDPLVGERREDPGRF